MSVFSYLTAEITAGNSSAMKSADIEIASLLAFSIISKHDRFLSICYHPIAQETLVSVSPTPPYLPRNLHPGARISSTQDIEKPLESRSKTNEAREAIEWRGERWGM